MALKVVRNDNLFRIESQELNTTLWLPDTRANRKVMIVSLRLLCDDNGKPSRRLSLSALHSSGVSLNRRQ